MASTLPLTHKQAAFADSAVPGPGKHDSLKKLIALQRDPLNTLKSLSGQYGGLFRLQPGPAQLWIASDPKYLQRALYEHPEHYARSGLFRSLKPALGDGLMVSANNDRDGLHEILSSAFQPKRLAKLSDVVRDCVQRRAEHWRSRAEAQHDMVAELQQLSLEILSQLCFGREGQTMARSIQPLLSDAHQWMDRRGNKILNPPGWMPSANNRRVKASMQQLDTLLARPLQHARPRMRDADTLLDLLVGLRGSDGDPLPTETLLSELRGLLLLAQRNLGSASFWASWLLAGDASSQHLVNCEAKTIKERGEENITAQAAYSRMVIEEALRLYPPTWSFSRQVIEDDVIGDHVIPAGSLLLIPNILIHRNSSLWLEPDAFQPERFSAVNRVNRQRGAWLPFGAGPMQCVGEQLSIAVLQLTILHIAEIGRWRPTSDVAPDIAGNLVLEPRGKALALFVPHR